MLIYNNTFFFYLKINAGVDALNLKNSRRNILANFQTNEDLLDDLDDDEEPADDSSDDDTNTKKYDSVEESKSNTFNDSSDTNTNMFVNSNEESSIESNPISPKKSSGSLNKRKKTEKVPQHFLSKYKQNRLL